MTKLGIYGYGKMGSAIHKIALANHQFDNVVTCDKDDKIEDLILASDLILDFSINIATEYLIESLLKSPSHVNGLLIGTTSLSPKSIDAINILAKNMAVLCAPNVSLGANLLAKLASNVAKILGKKYDIDIIEKHHKHKVDAPSGTALMIANSIAETRDLAIDAKPLSPRKESTISLHSIRSGSMAGEHEVNFCSADDSFTLIHRIYDRNLLVKDAIEIGLWLKDKKPGLYNINDFLRI